jgi:uncharacterized protein (DUF2235 family)
MNKEGKNIILCSDGTGNRGGKGHGTNVWALYNAVDTSLDAPRQITFYEDGVGTQDFKILKLLGGAFGLGLGRNIRDLYTFLVKNYNQEDRIFLFGFSRGAFTVRSLAGLIQCCGILNREKIGQDGRPPTALEIRKWVKKAYAAYRADHRWDRRFFRNWLPRKSHSERILDEKSFKNVEQVWFAGAHSNVGGGYPKQGMARVTLSWMMGKAHLDGKGVHFKTDVVEAVRRDANVPDRFYDSRSGAGSYYRYKPRNIRTICSQAESPVRIHRSVFERIDRASQDYAPGNVPGDFDQLISGSKVNDEWSKVRPVLNDQDIPQEAHDGE